MMQEKRGMMKVWNIWLVFTTFMLCILGTLLTRSGVVASVHAFAQSSIGSWFTTFLCLVFAVLCLFVYIRNRDYLRSDNQLDSLVSRESGLSIQQSGAAGSVLRGFLGHLVPGFLRMVHQ